MPRARLPLEDRGRTCRTSLRRRVARRVAVGLQGEEEEDGTGRTRREGRRSTSSELASWTTTRICMILLRSSRRPLKGHMQADKAFGVCVSEELCGGDVDARWSAAAWAVDHHLCPRTLLSPSLRANPSVELYSTSSPLITLQSTHPRGPPASQRGACPVPSYPTPRLQPRSCRPLLPSTWVRLQHLRTPRDRRHLFRSPFRHRSYPSSATLRSSPFSLPTTCRASPPSFDRLPIPSQPKAVSSTLVLLTSRRFLCRIGV